MPSAKSHAGPRGTFAPGTKVQVGNWQVVIEKYLSEGGFAHVYVVRLPRALGDGVMSAVLKRVAVPDKQTLASMRTEVETMKRLRGHRHIVTYIDSHVSQLAESGFEVFLLMEYCNGGGLMDFMNTRLQYRLTEPEILKIFSHISTAVSNLHYLDPPLLHRDLKIENVLISFPAGLSAKTSPKTVTYKLCDFGSAALCQPAAASIAQGRLIEEDVQKHTTLQYRSPEMIDVYRHQPIDEKSDIWALGVLLYKLCYYTTPFEAQGQMAILNASFDYPTYPKFSSEMKNLIGTMLQEKPSRRPNIYQIIRQVSLMRGHDVTVKNIYADQESCRKIIPQSSASTSIVGEVSMANGARKTLETRQVGQVDDVPSIVPMRRGRLAKASGSTETNQKYLPHKNDPNLDPFEALDSTAEKSLQSIDDASARFPPIDDFSLLHEKGNRFSFDDRGLESAASSTGLKDRVTNALADEAFARPASRDEQLVRAPSNGPGRSNAIRSQSRPKSSLLLAKDADGLSVDQIGTSEATQREESLSKMVSTGTMTSPTESPILLPQHPVSKRGVFRIPSIKSSKRASNPSVELASESYSGPSNPHMDRGGQRNERPHSAIMTDEQPISLGLKKRTSYSGNDKASSHKVSTGPFPPREKSLHSSRPHVLQRDSSDRPRNQDDSRLHDVEDRIFKEEKDLISETAANPEPSDQGAFAKDVDYLRAMEEDDSRHRRHKRKSNGSLHMKRASTSWTGSKQILSGRLGEVFRRFENTNNEPSLSDRSSKVNDCEDQMSLLKPHDTMSLTPITGSEATDERSDDGIIHDESIARKESDSKISAESRRELERLQLEEEERRVTEAAVAYKARVNKSSMLNPSHSESNNTKFVRTAAVIQNRVQSLLDKAESVTPASLEKASGRQEKDSTNLERRLANAPSSLTIRSQLIKAPIAKYPPRKSSAQPLSQGKDLAVSGYEIPRYKTLRSTGLHKPWDQQAEAHEARTSVVSQTTMQLADNQNERLGMNARHPATPKLKSANTALPVSTQQNEVEGAEDWEQRFHKSYPDVASLILDDDLQGSVTPLGGTALTSSTHKSESYSANKPPFSRQVKESTLLHDRDEDSLTAIRYVPETFRSTRDQEHGSSYGVEHRRFQDV